MMDLYFRLLVFESVSICVSQSVSVIARVFGADSDDEVEVGAVDQEKQPERQVTESPASA